MLLDEMRRPVTRRRVRTEPWEALAELPWVKRTGRRDEPELVDERRDDLAALLDRLWPEWGEVLTALTARGLPPTPEG